MNTNNRNEKLKTTSIKTGSNDNRTDTKCNTDCLQDFKNKSTMLVNQTDNVIDLRIDGMSLRIYVHCSKTIVDISEIDCKRITCDITLDQVGNVIGLRIVAGNINSDVTSSRIVVELSSNNVKETRTDVNSIGSNVNFIRSVVNFIGSVVESLIMKRMQSFAPIPRENNSVKDNRTIMLTFHHDMKTESDYNQITEQV